MNEYDDNKRIFSRNLLNQMAERNMTQADLARALHTTSASVANWCTGKQLPKMDRIEMIARYFNIDKSVLICDIEIMDMSKLTEESKARLMSYYNFLLKEQNNDK